MQGLHLNPSFTHKDPNNHSLPHSSPDIKCFIPVDPLILTIHVNNWCKMQFFIFSWSSDMTHLDVQRLHSYHGNTVVFYNIDSPVKPMGLDQCQWMDTLGLCSVNDRLD